MAALWTFVILFATIHPIGGIVAPLVFKRGVNLHPTVAIAVLYLGFTLAGVGGAIVSVPLAAAVQVLVVNLYLEPKRQRERTEATGR